MVLLYSRMSEAKVRTKRQLLQSPARQASRKQQTILIVSFAHASREPKTDCSSREGAGRVGYLVHVADCLSVQSAVPFAGASVSVRAFTLGVASRELMAVHKVHCRDGVFTFSCEVRFMDQHELPKYATW